MRVRVRVRVCVHMRVRVCVWGGFFLNEFTLSLPLVCGGFQGVELYLPLFTECECHLPPKSFFYSVMNIHYVNFSSH